MKNQKTLKPELAAFVNAMPKTALHMHIEGALEAHLAWQFASEQHFGPKPKKPLIIPKPDGGSYEVRSLAELEEVYNFNDLESFLNVYNKLATLLKTKKDFQRLGESYAEKCLAENIKHAEIFFDPQTHISRGIPFQTVVDGLQTGLQKGREKGLSIVMIASILRDHPVGSPDDEGDITSSDYNPKNSTAWAAAHCITAYNKLTMLPGGAPDRRASQWRLVGVGLDNNEVGFPPDLFVDVYAYLRDNGLYAVAHAGEEGPPAFIRQAITDLKVVRVDHGVRAIEDPNLLSLMGKPNSSDHILKFYHQPHPIPVTVCPLSNYKLKVFHDPTLTNIVDLLDLGIMATVNSDDPAYFGGYVTANYIFLLQYLNPKVAKAEPINLSHIFKLAKNGFEASILPLERKNQFLAELQYYFLTTPGTLYKEIVGN
jgi:adenosine deaminase